MHVWSSRVVVNVFEGPRSLLCFTLLPSFALTSPSKQTLIAAGLSQ